MMGGTVGEVVESRDPKFAVGDKVVGMGGWQEYSVVDANAPGALRKVDTTHVPLSYYLGAVGMPGVTAWYGLVKIIAPKAGETVVVSAATGAVGSAFAALAKARGCRVVGIAGGADKCRYAIEELGFDACIDYHEHPDLKTMAKALKEACPNGIDGYFENVGGYILDAVLLRTNAFARMALCGMIAGYDGQPAAAGQPGAAPGQPHQARRLYRQRAHGSLARGPDRAGRPGGQPASCKPRESIAQGLAAAPEAFLGLLKGKTSASSW